MTAVIGSRASAGEALNVMAICPMQLVVGVQSIFQQRRRRSGRATLFVEGHPGHGALASLR